MKTYGIIALKTLESSYVESNCCIQSDLLQPSWFYCLLMQIKVQSTHWVVLFKTVENFNYNNKQTSVHLNVVSVILSDSV